jgi:hypothetical protein
VETDEWPPLTLGPEDVAPDRRLSPWQVALLLLFGLAVVVLATTLSLELYAEDRTACEAAGHHLVFLIDGLRCR